MLTRILSALVGLVVLVLFLSMGKLIFTLGVFLITIVGLKEFYSVFIKKEIKPMKCLGYISAIFIILIGISGVSESIDKLVNQILQIENILLFMTLIFFILIVRIVFQFGKFGIIDASVTMMGIIYVVGLFSFVVLTKNLPNGDKWLWMVFIGAWATDTTAYFGGRFFGKRKILPRVSPKKTLEGAIGGVIGSIVGAIVFSLVLGWSHINFYHFVVIGLLNGVISQFGDWGASAIKRNFDVKDYGNIMPGHGGVLDRFDSILFIAPTVYFYVVYFIV